MAYWLIDQGNTLCKCRYVSDAAQMHDFTVSNQQLVDNDMSPLFNKPADAAFVASVANAQKYQALEKLLHGYDIQRVRTEPQAFGVTNAYEDCSRHGVDRWLVMLAAFTALKAPTIVIDCGTAITVDVVNGEGQHEGGYIVPSECLMAETLQVSTGDIHLLSDAENKSGAAGGLGFGYSTEAGVYLGVELMAQSFLRQVLQWAEDSHYAAIVTGGGALQYSQVFAEYRVRIVPDLVINGLNLYARQYSE